MTGPKLILLTLLALFVSPAAMPAQQLVFAGSVYPPYVITHPTPEQPAPEQPGIVIDILQLFDRSHPEYEIIYKTYPSKRCSKYMAEGREIALAWDVLQLAPRREGHSTHYAYSEIFQHTEDVVVTRRESNVHYTKPADLAGMRIATLLGYEYPEFDEMRATGTLEYQEVTTHERALGLLLKGRVDAYFGNIHVTPYHIHRLGLTPKLFRFTATELYEMDLCFAVSKKTDVLPKLNRFIRRIKEDGTLTAIVDSYFRPVSLETPHPCTPTSQTNTPPSR